MTFQLRKMIYMVNKAGLFVKYTMRLEAFATFAVFWYLGLELGFHTGSSVVKLYTGTWELAGSCALTDSSV